MCKKETPVCDERSHARCRSIDRSVALKKKKPNERKREKQRQTKWSWRKTPNRDDEEDVLGQSSDGSSPPPAMTTYTTYIYTAQQVRSPHLVIVRMLLDAKSGQSMNGVRLAVRVRPLVPAVTFDWMLCGWWLLMLMDHAVHLHAIACYFVNNDDRWSAKKKKIQRSTFAGDRLHSMTSACRTYCIFHKPPRSGQSDPRKC